MAIGLLCMMFAARASGDPAPATPKSAAAGSTRSDVSAPTAFNTGLLPPPADFDSSTPRRAWLGLSAAVKAGNQSLAANYLDLSEVPPQQQPILGADAAGKLLRLFKVIGMPRADSLPDEVDPRPPQGGESGTWTLARFEKDGVSGQVLLTRVSDPASGKPLWLVSRATVGAIGGWVSELLTPKGTTAAPEARLNVGLGPVPKSMDLSRPRRAVKSFLDACHEGRYGQAAHFLWLNGVEPERQREVGPLLARQFKIVLDHYVWIRYEAFSDEPFGKPELSPVPEDEDQFGSLPLGPDQIPLRLQRVPGPLGNEKLWVLSPETVDAIPALYDEHGLGWVGVHLPAVLTGVRVLEMEPWQWLGFLIVLVLAGALGIVLERVALTVGRWLAARTRTPWDDRLLQVLHGPLRCGLGLALAPSMSRWLLLAKPVQSVVDDIIRTASTLVAGWLLMRLVTLATAVAQVLLSGEAVSETDIRSVRTRLELMERLGLFVVGLFTLAYVLMPFAAVRAIGTGLLASAGVTGLVIGIAAQKTLSNLFGGLQLGITQPVRIGDEVVFENEWGWIEAITLTHVVIRIWDLRRLVVPIPYLLERPIQNWTRLSPEILGTVFIYADYTVDVEALRRELARILEETPLWDRKCPPVLQVTDLKEGTVELRALCSAASSGQAWDLRCLVREKMLQAMRSGDRLWIPMRRIELTASRERLERPSSL